MSARMLLRALVNERLTAVAEEIFQVFERTIAKYEEEASSSKQEIERLRCLLLDSVSKQKSDISLSFICKEEAPAELHHCEQEQSHAVCQRGVQHIKEEQEQEPWASRQLEDDEDDDEDEEEEGGGGGEQEYKDAGDSFLPQSSVWDENEPEDTKPLLQTDTSEGEEQFQESKTPQFFLPLASTSQPLVQDGRENERPGARFARDAQSDPSRGAFIASRDAADSALLSSILPDCRCHLCDKSFTSNHHLINHALRVHSKESDVLCAVCGKILESNAGLNVHLKTHKSAKCCHVCGKHYSSATSLTEHMASHAGVKLHRCHVCGKECGRKGDLKIHMRIHTGEKPFCCSYCHKSFTHSGHLRKHMRSHTGERPHRCDICGRGFLQSTHLKYHLGTHTQKY